MPKVKKFKCDILSIFQTMWQRGKPIHVSTWRKKTQDSRGFGDFRGRFATWTWNIFGRLCVQHKALFSIGVLKSSESLSFRFIRVDSGWLGLTQIDSGWLRLTRVDSGLLGLSQVYSGWIRLNQIESNWLEFDLGWLQLQLSQVDLSWL